MADVRSLDGAPLDIAKIGRNEPIADLLERVGEKNDEGRIAAIAVVTLSPEGWYETTWQWPTGRADGFPWALAMQGALGTVIHEMRDRVTVHAPLSPKKEP